MRGRAIAALLLGLCGCGRIGYDPVATGDDVGVDASPDTPDAPPGVLAECNVAVEVAELPTPIDRHVGAIEIGATTTGFVAVYKIEDAVWAAGLSETPSHYIDVIQSGGQIFNDYSTTDLSIDSNGDRAVLAADNVGADAIYFYPLAETGYQRGSTKSADAVHAHGRDFLVADPVELLFGVAGSNGTDVVSLEREIDSHPNVDAITTLPGIVPETTGITRLGDGYAVISGRGSQCDIIAVDDGIHPIGTAQVMSMTCHNAQIVNPTGDHIVAAWNCDDNQVWITGGSMSGTLPMQRSVYGTDGDTANSCSNPHLAPTSTGVWYAFQVAGGRLGRLLVDENGDNVDTVTPAIVVPSGVGDYDLVSRADEAYLFWTVPDTTTHLWAMRLCQ